MENIFLDWGLSWSISKITPHILMLLIGLILTVKIKRIHMVFRILLLPVPFILYFIFYPIYQGDFSNNNLSTQVGNLKMLKDNELSVLAIPGCPFCHESIRDLKKIKKRTKTTGITFYVITDDVTTLDWYREEANGSFDIVRLSPETEGIKIVTGGSFPTFILRDGDQLTAWSNSNFGVRAKDEVEKQLKKGS